jgi:succinoglycan biosynthesis transport protein ExoP
LIAHPVRAGLSEVLRKSTPMYEAFLVDSATNLVLLPSFSSTDPPDDRTLNHRLMLQFLEEAQDVFDHIILDLPPIAPVIDARSIAPAIDTFVFVVEWGVTSRKAIRAMIESEAEIFDKCCGVVLNKTNLHRMKYYAHYGSIDYYRDTYGDYINYHKNT